MDMFIMPLINKLAENPKLVSAIVLFIVVHTAIKAFFDSLVASRQQWDKTPDTDDTWYEKTLTWAVRILGVTGKAVAYLAGFRPKKVQP